MILDYQCDITAAQIHLQSGADTSAVLSQLHASPKSSGKWLKNSFLVCSSVGAYRDNILLSLCTIQISTGKSSISLTGLTNIM